MIPQSFNQLDLLVFGVWNSISHLITDILVHQVYQCVTMFRIVEITGNNVDVACHIMNFGLMVYKDK